MDKNTTMNRTIRPLLLAAVSLLALVAPAAADVASDRPAAILVFPRLRYLTAEDQFMGADRVFTTDTILQVSNTSSESVTMQCFYISVTGHCALSGVACGLGAGSELEGSCDAPDVCVPGWTETDFRVILTPHQPLAWRASEGLTRDQFPLDGLAFRGPRGETNAGSAIPPVAAEELPSGTMFFVGELKCIVVDDQGRAIDRNVLKGEATVVTNTTTIDGDETANIGTVERYNGIGIQAIGGDVNGDGVLEIGGEAAEYNACPSVLILEHFFDSGGGGVPSTAITLVPCSEDIRSQQPARVTAQFLVFNEFEQRFSTSTPVDCYYNRLLSSIDTANPDRSIFSSGVAGTTVGQTRIRGVQGGLLGIAAETAAPPSAATAQAADRNLHLQGERSTADLLILP